MINFKLIRNDKFQINYIIHQHGVLVTDDPSKFLLCLYISTFIGYYIFTSYIGRKSAFYAI